MAFTKVADEPHPVTPERKRELNAAGYQIIDAVFAPPGPAPAPADFDDAHGEMTKAEIVAALEARGMEVDGRTGVAKLKEMLAALETAEVG